jgi:hypothetical protein
MIKALSDIRKESEKIDNLGANALKKKIETHIKSLYTSGLAIGEDGFTVYKGKKPTVDKNGNVISVDKSKTSKTGLTDSLFFVNYKKDAIAANIGVVPLGFLPYASSDSWGTAHGAGADATYTLNDNLTLAAGYVDQIWNAKNVSSQDIYTVGAIYKNKDLGSAQLWYATVVDTLKYDVMLMTKLNVLKDQGIGVNIDIAQSKSDDKNADSHNFFNIALTGKVSGADVKVGYAATNDKKGVINTSGDSKIGKTAGELRHNVANLTNATAIYAKAGYKLDKATKVFVAYDNISANEGDSNEYEVGAKYKVNKKFGISGYVDYLDNAGSAANDTTEARVEFKYSF